MQEKQPSLIIALIPIILLITLLSINVSLFGDNTISGSNQLTLLISAACAALLGLSYNIKYKEIQYNPNPSEDFIDILLIIVTLHWLIVNIS